MPYSDFRETISVQVECRSTIKGRNTSRTISLGLIAKISTSVLREFHNGNAFRLLVHQIHAAIIQAKVAFFTKFFQAFPEFARKSCWSRM